MKKSVLATLFIGALAMYSCTSDLPDKPAAAMDKVPVIFKVNNPNDMGSRAFSDGTTATKLSYAVFEGSVADLKAAATTPASLMGKVNAATFTSKKTELTLNLATGSTYTVVFWADAGDDSPYTFDTTNGTVAIDNTAFVTNDEKRDAFCNMVDITVSGTSSQDVTLTRPFAQLNIGTTDSDLEAYETSLGGNPTIKTAVEMTAKLYSGFDIINGDVTGSGTSYTITKDVLPTSETLTVNVNGTAVDYNYLSMNYLPVAKTGEVVDVKLLLYNGDTELPSRQYENVPLKRNYRTNIIGDLLCAATTFQILINNEYDGNYTQVVSTAAELKKALAVKDADIVLVDDIALDVAVGANGETNIDLGGNTLSLTSASSATTAPAYAPTGSTLSLSNGDVHVTTGDFRKSAIEVKPDATLELDGVNFKIEDLNKDSNAISLYTGSSANLKNCTFDDTCGFNATTNASDVTASTPPITFTAEDCTFTGASPLLFNVPCIVTLTNCVSTGSMHGLVMRGGTAIVKDCVLNMAFDESEAYANVYSSYFNTIPWDQGNTLTLGGLIMGNKQNPGAYQYPTNVILINTKINILNFANLFPAVYAWANDTPEYGVTFTYDEDCTFNNNILTYANNGKNITVNGVAQQQP